MTVVVGAAARPVAGETVCGDAFAVVSFEGGTLLCLADGLGHGPAARSASAAACLYALENAAAPLETLMRGMDRALSGLRGAAVSLLSLQPRARRVQFAGIGNVEVRALSRVPVAPPTTPGIVGHRMRSVRVWEYPLAEGDLLVLMSDGVSGRFDLTEFSHLEPQALAEALLAKHHKSHDDGCCVVARIGTGARAT